MAKVDLNTLGGRLWSLAKGHQLSDRAFGELFDLTPQAVNKWFHNLSKPRTAMLERVAREMEANLTWLITGTGDPGRVQGTVRMVQDIATVRQTPSLRMLEPPRAVDQPVGVRVSLADAHNTRGLEWLPTLSSDGKLSGATAVDKVPTYAAMRAASLRERGYDGEHCIVMTAPNAVGDIREGDAIMVDRNVAINSDAQIYAVDIDGAKTIRKVFRRPGGKLLLRSGEDDYEVASDARGFSIIGEVVWRGGYCR